jgi:hypothetical protein
MKASENIGHPPNESGLVKKAIEEAKMKALLELIEEELRKRENRQVPKDPGR